MRQLTPRGFTKLELVAVLAVITVLLAIVGVGISRALADARFQTDVRQITELHTSWIVAAYETNAAVPLPSLAVSALNDNAEDFSLNHSANLYSLMIIRHYFTPDMLISPLEVSDHVTEADYDFSKYDPLNDVYWDPSFVMNIDDPNIGANASYAHIAAIGDRRTISGSGKSWPGSPILGTRGPDVANLDAADHHRSPTALFCKPNDRWVGNIAFRDNHVKTRQTLSSLNLTYGASSDSFAQPDNIFSADFDHPNGRQAAADAFLCICTGATQFTVDDVYDPLLDD